jgi:hypothetical protein
MIRPKVHPKPLAQPLPEEPERKRKSTVERKKERFGEKPAPPMKTSKDLTKYAQRTILKKQRYR